MGEGVQQMAKWNDDIDLFDDFLQRCEELPPDTPIKLFKDRKTGEKYWKIGHLRVTITDDPFACVCCPPASAGAKRSSCSFLDSAKLKRNDSPTSGTTKLDFGKADQQADDISLKKSESSIIKTEVPESQAEAACPNPNLRAEVNTMNSSCSNKEHEVQETVADTRRSAKNPENQVNSPSSKSIAQAVTSQQAQNSVLLHRNTLANIGTHTAKPVANDSSLDNESDFDVDDIGISEDEIIYGPTESEVPVGVRRVQIQYISGIPNKQEEKKVHSSSSPINSPPSLQPSLHDSDSDLLSDSECIETVLIPAASDSILPPVEPKNKVSGSLASAMPDKTTTTLPLHSELESSREVESVSPPNDSCTPSADNSKTETNAGNSHSIPSPAYSDVTPPLSVVNYESSVVEQTPLSSETHTQSPAVASVSDHDLLSDSEIFNQEIEAEHENNIENRSGKFEENSGTGRQYDTAHIETSNPRLSTQSESSPQRQSSSYHQKSRRNERSRSLATDPLEIAERQRLREDRHRRQSPPKYSSTRSQREESGGDRSRYIHSPGRGNPGKSRGVAPSSNDLRSSFERGHRQSRPHRSSGHLNRLPRTPHRQDFRPRDSNPAVSKSKSRSPRLFDHSETGNPRSFSHSQFRGNSRSRSPHNYKQSSRQREQLPRGDARQRERGRHSLPPQQYNERTEVPLVTPTVKFCDPLLQTQAQLRSPVPVPEFGEFNPWVRRDPMTPSTNPPGNLQHQQIRFVDSSLLNPNVVDSTHSFSYTAHW